MINIPLGYRCAETIGTDWCIVDYYIIPESLRFTVTWEYGGGWADHVPKTTVKQTAYYVKIVRRRSDLSFFDFQILEKDFTTIRGKHCRGIRGYKNIYKDFVPGN